jgi:AraC-like DNA-binding protein
MFVYVPYLSFLTSGIGLLFIFFLIARFRNIDKVYWLIGIVFCIVWMEFYMFALTSKHIYQLLFLSRSANPFRAFIPVFLYFYVGSMLNSKHKIKPIQWLHFVFPVIITLAVAPDFFLPDTQKIALLDAYYTKNNILLLKPAGLIPSGIVQPLLIGFGLAYCAYIICLLQQIPKRKGEEFRRVNRQIIIWLNLLCISIGLFFVFQMVQYFSLSYNHIYNPLSQIFKCLMVLIFCGYLIITPNVHENMDGCVITKKQKNVPQFPSKEELIPQLLPEHFHNPLAQKIDQFVKNEQCFLNKSCDLNSMAKQLEISPTKLSAHIKLFYGMTFVEFINRRRIHHFLSAFDHYNTFTFETYIYDSGFNNRSTFYASFKKYVGINPSAYLKFGKDLGIKN